MVRIVVIVSICLAGCDVGELPGLGGDGGTGDGTSAICENISATIPAGHHNPGLGCRSAAACHNAQLGLGTGAPEYSYAGTVYKDTAGTIPYPGATIFVTMGGMTKKTISADNGNFWMVPVQLAGPSNAMQADTKASACPNSPPMVGKLGAGGGDCNNCHKTGGTTAPVYILP